MIRLFVVKSGVTRCVRCFSSIHNKADLRNPKLDRRVSAKESLQKKKSRAMAVEHLIKPVNIKKPNFVVTADISNFSESVPLNKDDISEILDKFCRQSMVREEAKKKGISDKFFMSIYNSFRLQCIDVTSLKPELRVLFSDIKNFNHSVDLLFPFFLSHAQSLYPHLDSLDDMKIISDLAQPHDWYPEARSIHRKIVFHAGPTNSGKTYNALKRFKEAESGIYCGPLRLLASEVFKSTNAAGV